ncbi:unnamed protein product, partial [Mesorhabditis spiculigera]
MQYSFKDKEMEPGANFWMMSKHEHEFELRFPCKPKLQYPSGIHRIGRDPGIAPMQGDKNLADEQEQQGCACDKNCL